jgi:transposase
MVTGLPTVVTDALWEQLRPLLPAPSAFPGPGRPRVDDRACLEGILYVARRGVPWAAVPPGLGYAHGKTCWRRLDQWTQAGVWERLLERVISDLADRERLDLDRLIVDATTTAAKKGAPKRARARSTAANPPAKSTL